MQTNVNTCILTPPLHPRTENPHPSVHPAAAGDEDRPASLGESLSGVKTPVWRFRVGDYRLLCEVHAVEKRLVLLDVGNRDGIYLLKR